MPFHLKASISFYISVLFLGRGIAFQLIEPNGIFSTSFESYIGIPLWKLSSNCNLSCNLQVGVVLAVPRMQVLLGLCTMLFPGALLLAIITYQQIRRHFFWSFLISLFGQMFMFKIMPGLLFHCAGVVSRFVKFRFVISTGRALVPYMWFDLTFWPTYIGTFHFWR
jgi:hypothetical protein